MNTLLIKIVFRQLFSQFINGESLGYHPYGGRICKRDKPSRIGSGIDNLPLPGNEFPLDEVFSVIEPLTSCDGNGIANGRRYRDRIPLNKNICGSIHGKSRKKSHSKNYGTYKCSYFSTHFALIPLNYPKNRQFQRPQTKYIIYFEFVTKIFQKKKPVRPNRGKRAKFAKKSRK
ncbi:MAG: hypothetical protein IK012_02105 [Fibrobacter sp.]|uniref:hypothetical protein n=1 Tax=Fibrobacter sp. TaxID=35828 RepID=UPI0025B9CEFD|nr:hypothetical protein [Fibrobacter sp.]MBR4784029.1 hypothetical protein [Fibrobacter sp.]